MHEPHARSSPATGRCTRRSRRPRSSSRRCCRRSRRPTASTSRSAPPFTALQAMVDSARGSRVRGLRAEHARGRRGRVHRRGVARRCSTELDVARRRARPLRAPPATSARPTARCALKVPAALDGRPDADPVRRRDRGGARARRHRAQAAPPGPGGAREGRRTSGCAEVVDRLRADLGDRHRPQSPRPSRRRRRSRSCARSSAGLDKAAGQAVRILYGGSRQARERRRAAGAARRRRRAGRRREPRPGVVRADRRDRARGGRDAVSPSPASAWSSSTAGGWRRTGRATRSRSPTRRCSTSCGTRYPHTQLTACGEAVGLPDGADGQLRGRPPQPRRGRGRPAGPRAHRRGGRGRLAGRERGAARRAARRAARAPDRARLRRRRALVRPAT